MSLASEIKNRLANKTSTTPTGEQAAATKKLIQKSTGKQVAGGPRTSNIGEQVLQDKAKAAQDTTRASAVTQASALQQSEQGVADKLAQGREQLASKGRTSEQGIIAGEQAAQMNVDFRADESEAKLSANEDANIKQINHKADQQLQQLASDRGVSLDSIFSKFSKSNKELEFREDAAELEQLAFNLRLRDNEYVDTINRVAKENNLEDELAFREESQKLIWGEEMASLMRDLGFKSDLNISAREFAQKLGKMDVNAAMAVYDSQQQAANSQMVIQGGTSALNAGLEYADEKDKKDK